MKFLWVTWKDWQHPGAGGAEVVLHELAKRQVADGHSVTILTALYPGAVPQEDLDGMHIIRLRGNRYVQPFVTLPYYLRHMRGKFDVVIEAVNTAPYFTPFFRGKAKSVLLYHQLARQIWFYEAPLPIAAVGFAVLEPMATFMLGKSPATTITVSNSTQADLRRFGFNPQRMHIISEGIQRTPLPKLDKLSNKYQRPTLFAHGSMRAMKRMLHQIQAFEIAKQHIPDLQLHVSGSSSGKYGQKVLQYIQASPYAHDITYHGRTTDQQRDNLMRKSHIHLQTATKEGWGITITEANSLGTPCVVYNVDGLRDAVQHGKTGIITNPNPTDLAAGIVHLLQDQQLYNAVRTAAWEWSKTITFDQSYKDFNRALESA